MWQSAAFAGALSLGGSVPAEFGTLLGVTCATCSPEVVTLIAAIEAPLINERRAIIFFLPNYVELMRGYTSSAHLTIVNSRLQRTDHGQLQMCQAGSPSPIEKKMICALPTRFSNGT